LLVAQQGSAWLLFAVLGSYLTSAILVSATICMKEGWRFFLKLPIVFAVMHIGYGTGFLCGIAVHYLVDSVRKRKVATG
jgi:hypothetical protein